MWLGWLLVYFGCLLVSVSLKMALLYEDFAIGRHAVPAATFGFGFVVMKVMVVSVVETNQKLARPWREALDPKFLALRPNVTGLELLALLTSYTQASAAAGEDVNMRDFKGYAVRSFAEKGERLGTLLFALLSHIYERFEAAWLSGEGALPAADVAQRLLAEAEDKKERENDDRSNPTVTTTAHEEHLREGGLRHRR